MVLDLECPGLRLRFEERCEHRFPVGELCGEVLLVGRGTEWMEVDVASHRGPESYSRLLPQEVGFRAFPFEGKRKSDYSRQKWGVFVNPALVSRAEYDGMAACLAANLDKVDLAFALRGGGLRELERPQLTSIVHAAYDAELASCGEKTIGRRWTCGDGEGYIKTRVPPDGPPFILCATARRPQRMDGGRAEPQYGMVVGNISTDQRAVLLAAPGQADDEYQKLLAGRDAQAYYATCRDTAGERFFDTFQACDATGRPLVRTPPPKATTH